MSSKIAIIISIILQIAVLTSGKSLDLKDKNSEKNYWLVPSDKYPQQLIDNLAEKENLIETVYDLRYRGGDAIMNNDCETRTYFEPIYEIIDDNNNVRYVVQTSDDAKKPFRQILRMEECVNPGKISQSTYNFDLNSSLLQSYDFSCKQTVMNYSFLVISLDGQKFEAAKAKGGIPVCCKCIVKERNDI